MIVANPLMRVLSGVLLLLSFAAIPAHAADAVAGLYRSTGSPDSASRIELTADGRFRYILSEGALDEMAQGRWRREGAVIRLWTEPRPVPPRITVAAMGTEGPDALSIAVTAPGGGGGIAGVEFRVEFDKGEPLEGYTQYDGWRTDALGGRVPRHIQLHEPIHGVTSDRFAIPPGGRALRFTFTPNDLGVVDFQGTALEVEGDRLILHHRFGDRPYVRVTG